MYWQRKILAVSTLVAGIAGFGAAGYAAQDTDTFQVSATVNSACTIAANPLSFGTYDAAGANVDATTTLDVTCSNGSNYRVGLDGGSTAADVNNRAMSGPGVNLGYALFQNSARTTNWGNTFGTDTVAGTGTGAGQTLTVYGRLFSGQFSTAGFYSDDVVATVDF